VVLDDAVATQDTVTLLSRRSAGSAARSPAPPRSSRSSATRMTTATRASRRSLGTTRLRGTRWSLRWSRMPPRSWTHSRRLTWRIGRAGGGFAGADRRAGRRARRRQRPVTRTASASSNPPAWDTSPWPSADTVILARRAVLFTCKVPSLWCGQVLRQAPSSQAKALLLCERSRSADHGRKPEANLRDSR
jgi:hypothetical protein